MGSRGKQVTNTCYCAASFDLGEFKSVKPKVVSLRKQAVNILMGYMVSVFLSPNDLFLALILLANVQMGFIFSIACPL